MRAPGIAIVVLLATSAASASAFDLAHLMQLLAETPESRVPFVERKYSALLAEPLVSRGTLAYRRPDLVEKVVVSPRPERFRIEGDELFLYRDGTQRRVRLSSEPLLAAFAASLRGVLSGNATLLAEHYRLALEGTQEDWKLEMTPLDADISRYVAGIVVSGRAGRVGTLEVRESNGDRSVLTVN